MKSFLQSQKAQMAIEYMLLLMVVVSIVLIGFPKYLPQTRNAANTYFNRMVVGIMGKPNPCGDGFCDPNFEKKDCSCGVDCGGCAFSHP